MSAQTASPERLIYLAACKLQDPEVRREYLDEACGTDQILRKRLDLLLGLESGEGKDPLHQALRDLGHSPVDNTPNNNTNGKNGRPTVRQIDETVDARINISQHPVIGRYKLLEELGSGGMGAVYMAQQTAPVKRKVALKIIKPGMDSREVIARFQAERQALAMMDHPNIARVLDAGTTDEGRPYFVMELVRGIPITKFCEQKKFSLQDRLKLFIDVCKAVQHAHQKAIIHRDLKPSNILVTLHDGEPVVKVIDFGVAKALNQDLTDQTLFTQFSQMIGTPLYMSPEQAEMSGLDVDTRSDVYSLGVVLYELLTGTTPIERESLANLGYADVRKLVLEQEPERPSSRISTLKAGSDSTLARRKKPTRDITTIQLSSELDWIVMKALEKDRTRRFETANALSQDIERFLKNEPITARPPSFSYRLRKFARRNRGLLAASSLLAFISILGLMIGVNVMLQRDRASRQLAADIQGSMSAARAAIDSNDLVVAEQWAAQARGRLGGSTNRHLIEVVAQFSSELDERRQQQSQYERFRQLSNDVLQAKAYETQENTRENVPVLKDALNTYGVLTDDQWHDQLKASYLTEQQRNEVLETVYQLLLSYADYNVRWPEFRDALHAQESLEYLRRAALFHEPTRAFYFVRSVCHKHLENTEHMEEDLSAFERAKAVTAFDYYLPGHTAGWQGRLDEAVEAYKAALLIQPDHFNSLFFLAMRLSADGRNAEAAEIYRACLALRPDHVPTLLNRSNILNSQGETQEANELVKKAIALGDRKGGSFIVLAINRLGEGELEEAEELVKKALELGEGSGVGYGVRASIKVNLGQFEASLADFDEAENIFNRTGDRRNLKNVYNKRAEAYYRLGQKDRALRDLDAAVELAPNDGKNAFHFDSFRNRAMLLEENGEYVEALADVEEALRISEQTKRVGDDLVALAHSTRGRIFRFMQRSAEALLEFDKALELISKERESTLCEIRLFRAAALMDLERRQEAVRELDKVIQLTPKEDWQAAPVTFWKTAHHELAWHLGASLDFEDRDLTRAFELAEKAVELDAEKVSYWNTLGMVQYRREEFISAVQSLNKSLEFGVEGTEVPCNALFLAMAHWKLGEHDEALRWYSEAANWMKENPANIGAICPNDRELLRIQAETEDLISTLPESKTEETYGESDSNRSNNPSDAR